jgi:hypothetical protein
MAGRKRSPSAEGKSDPLDRIANLLALLLVKGESESEKILTLSAVGYSATDIATLLRKQANTVSVALYQARKTQTGRKK